MPPGRQALDGIAPPVASTGHSLAVAHQPSHAKHLAGDQSTSAHLAQGIKCSLAGKYGNASSQQQVVDMSAC